MNWAERAQRHRPGWTKTTLLGAAVAWIGFATTVHAEVTEHRLAATPGETVAVEIDFGEGFRPDPGWVRVSSHDSDQVEARVETSGWGAWDVEVSLERRAGAVRLDVRARGTTTWLFGGPNIRVAVAVPAGTTLDVASWGGDVQIDGHRGALRANVHEADISIHGVRGRVQIDLEGSASAEVDDVVGDLGIDGDDGTIRVARVTGRAEVRSNDGPVHLQDIEGPITAKTLDGDLELTHVTGAVTARTERGAIRVGFEGGSSGVVETERGDIAVTLPPGQGASLDAQAGDGTVDIAASGFDGERSGGRAVGTIGNGGPRLVVRSKRGDIRVSQR